MRFGRILRPERTPAVPPPQNHLVPLRPPCRGDGCLGGCNNSMHDFKLALPRQVVLAYAEAVHLDRLRIPYHYGGDTLHGLDCSKADSWVLRAAGVLPSLMGTIELARTTHLAEGVGEFMTLWVANTPALAHSLLEFDMPGHGRQWWAARETGTIVGFYPFAGGREWLYAHNFKPRRRR